MNYLREIKNHEMNIGNVLKDTMNELSDEALEQMGLTREDVTPAEEPEDIGWITNDDMCVMDFLEMMDFLGE